MKKIFIVGSGRSGTTWLHMMLGAHPRIATGQESQIFEHYLRQLDQRWKQEIDYPETSSLRQHGISTYIDEDGFYSLLREFAEGVFEQVMKAKPGADVFLEKSPSNSFHVDLMFRCFPQAFFIHMIRDARDVVTSMLAANSGWGRSWAPSRAFDAAGRWQRAVSESRRLRTLTSRYIEVRYEDLLARGESELSRVFESIGVDCSDEAVRAIYHEHCFDKLKQKRSNGDVFLNPGASRASGTTERPEPEGFFRKGVAGDWVKSLTPVQLREIEWVAGELMAELGYLPERVRRKAPPLSVVATRTVRETRQLLRRIGKKIV